MLTWEELEIQCNRCERCGLCKTRQNIVIGTGNREADVMFIGEGPGEQEDLRGEPFVGPAGKLLDDMLSIIDLDRTKVYIANVVKCRPPYNRDPSDEEMERCMLHLKHQIALVKPKMIICLGRVAARQVIDPTFRMTKSHGDWTQYNGIWMMGMYHPSALLRDPTKRPDAFDDLISIRDGMKTLGIIP